MTPIFTPLSDSGTEGVAKPENVTSHPVMKWVSSERIDDSSSPDDSVTDEMTSNEVTTSTAAEVNEITEKSMQPSLSSVISIPGTSVHC